jgi:hypothetical protein
MKEPTMTEKEREQRWLTQLATLVNDTIEALKVVAAEQAKHNARIEKLEKKS